MWITKLLNRDLDVGLSRLRNTDLGRRGKAPNLGLPDSRILRGKTISTSMQAPPLEDELVLRR